MTQTARILVINPNTSQSITALVLPHVARVLGPSVKLVGSTGAFGHSYISSEAAYAIAGHAAVDCLARDAEARDGVLLACFGDPALFALQELSPAPVVGLAQASMSRAAARSGRFSIVTGGAGWESMLRRFSLGIGLGDALASIRTVPLTGAQIAADPDAALAMLADLCEAAAREDGANEVILGGAGLAGLAERIQPMCRVPVADSIVEATTALAERIGLQV